VTLRSHACNTIIFYYYTLDIITVSINNREPRDESS